MPFAVEHSIDLSTLSLPEASPNGTAPLATRTFPSPTVAEGGAHALVGWADGGGPISFEAWHLAGNTWVLAGRREAADDTATPGIVLPPDAAIFVRVLLGTPPGVLRLAFRAPEAGDAAVDVGDLPPAIAPGADDPNDPTTFVAARLQLHDQSAGTWRNACYVDPGNPLIVPCALGVWISGPDVIAVSVTDGGGTPLAAAATPSVNDTGVTVRTVYEGDIAAIRTISGNIRDRLPASLGPQSYAASLSITQAVPPPTFTAIAQAVPIADDKSMISIALDGAAAGVIVIREIMLINQQTSPIPGQVVNFELLRFATHSAGTLLTAAPHVPADVLSGLVTIRSGATIVSPGALLRRWPIACDEWGSGALDTEAFQTLLGNLFPLWSAARDFAARPFTILPGGGVHVRVATPIAPATNITVLDAVVVFTSTVTP